MCTQSMGRPTVEFQGLQEQESVQVLNAKSKTEKDNMILHMKLAWARVLMPRSTFLLLQ